jgi:carboxymethylenebutenolidase
MNDLNEVAGLRRYPLARRGFVMTSLITGLTMATERVEAQAIHTDAAGLDAGEVKIPVPGGSLPAYYARPATGTKFPIVLVNEEIFGVHEYIKDVCRRLAKLGCLAVATEYYARIGDLSTMTDPAQIVRDVISKEPDAQYMEDLDTTAAWAAANKGDASRIGVIGFCRGGRMTWLYAAHNPDLKAAVAFYGPLGGAPTPIQPAPALDYASQIHCPLLGLYGGADPSIPVDQVHAAEAKAKAAGKTVDIVIYPDAPHGFHADYRPSYRPEVAEEAWKQAIAWLRRYGVAPAA